MKTIIITLLLAMAFVINSCSKDDENSLTAPTTDGSGTLSFLLDGKVWLPEASFGHFPYSGTSHVLEIEVTNYDSSKNKSNDFINIMIWARNNNKNQTFNLRLDSISNIGEYKIKTASFIDDGLIDKVFNLLDSSSIIRIKKIYLDYKSNIDNNKEWGFYSNDSYISGTFDLILKNKKGDSVLINDGRFDLKFQPY